MHVNLDGLDFDINFPFIVRHQFDQRNYDKIYSSAERTQNYGIFKFSISKNRKNSNLKSEEKREKSN